MVQLYAWRFFLLLTIAFPVAVFIKPQIVPGLTWFIKEFIEPWGYFGYIPICIVSGIFLGLTILFWFWSRQAAV